MNKNAKIYVAGHQGLVGSAFIRRLRALDYQNLLVRTHAELDLIDQQATDAFFAAEKPDYVFLAAARVGGLYANNTYRAEFLYQNLMIQSNTIAAAWRAGVQRLLFLGASCVYPRDCPQPILEDYFLTGPSEPTNEPYAIAKIAGIKLCESYNRQYGTQYLTVMPASVYGPNDSYDEKKSHVLPALIRKVYEAKIRGDQEIVIWGTGKPMREFLYVDDLADACIFLMNSHSAMEGLINIGTSEDVTISELAETIMEVVGFQGRLIFDTSKPDGSPRKLLNTDRMRALGWQPSTALKEGIVRAYQDFLERCSSF